MRRADRPSPRLLPALVAGCLLTAGCAEIPALEGTISPEAAAAPYPKVLPVERILDGAAAAQSATPETQAQLEARAAGLRARADRLRNRTMAE